MAVKVTFRVEGADPRNPDFFLHVPPELSDVHWTGDGSDAGAVVMVDDKDAVEAALACAARISELMPGVRVTGVRDELVTQNEVARRAGMLYDTISDLAAGMPGPLVTRRFPARREGTPDYAVYSWPEVEEWLRDHGRSPQGDGHLPRAQAREIGARLDRGPGAVPGTALPGLPPARRRGGQSQPGAGSAPSP